MQTAQGNTQNGQSGPNAPGILHVVFRILTIDQPITPSPRHPVREWPLLAIMAVLFVGPLIAPLLQATGLRLAADSGELARDLLSRYICPTPAKSYVLLGFPMAVCARCWGATIGLWAAWLAFRTTNDERTADGGHGGGHRGAALQVWLGWQVRLVVGALPFVLWMLEINAWPAAPRWALLVNGVLAGFWAGLFLVSIWPRLRHR